MREQPGTGHRMAGPEEEVGKQPRRGVLAPHFSVSFQGGGGGSVVTMFGKSDLYIQSPQGGWHLQYGMHASIFVSSLMHQCSLHESVHCYWFVVRRS